MKKVIQKMKEKDIDIFIFLLFIISIIASERLLEPSDELWTFSNIYKMLKGYTIYNDLNVIQTPLFFYIGVIFLKIFGANFLGYTIYNIVVEVIIFMLIFKLFKILQVPRRRNILYTTGILWAFASIIRVGANYNCLVYIPILITIILLIKNGGNPYLLGILTIATFLTKQTSGVYLGIGIVSYILFIQKIEIKEKIRQMIKYGITFILFLMIFLVILYWNKNLYSFLNYTFLGINEFGVSNFYINWIMTTYLALAGFIIIVSLFSINSKKVILQDNIKRNIGILLCVGTPLILTVYPIFNYPHMLAGMLILIIEFLYFIDIPFIAEMINYPKKEKIVISIVIFLFVVQTLFYLFGYIKSVMEKDSEYTISKDKNNPYYGIICENKLIAEIENICNFIQENNEKDIDVKVLSYKANLYMVPLNKNNKQFDLSLLGNLGKEGEDGLIKQIKNLKNTKILIQIQEEDMFWQESKRVRKFIQENYQKEGTIEDFDIYFIP